MTSIRFLSVDDVLAFHADTISNEGGASGLRDPALLDSAVAMPQATFDGDFLHAGIPGMAAAYLFHLCQAHAFIDGNKRTAILSCHAFLDINGWEFSVSADELFDVVFKVADSSTSKDQLTLRLPKIIRPRI
jgi:death on curing protein